DFDAAEGSTTGVEIKPVVRQIIRELYETSQSGPKMRAKLQARIDVANNADATDIFGNIAEQSTAADMAADAAAAAAAPKKSAAKPKQEAAPVASKTVGDTVKHKN